MNLRAIRKPSVVALGVMLLATLAFGVGVRHAHADDPTHGATIQKSCVTPRSVGQTTDCTITVTNADTFGDALSIDSAFDNVLNTGGPTRVPASGNLPISAVSGSTTCTVGGSLPCVLNTVGSSVSFHSNTYVIKANDPNPLNDQGTVTEHDVCNAPGSQPGGPNGCSTGTSTLQATASTFIGAPPTCVLTNVIAGPPKQLQITITAQAGLSSIVVDTPPTSNTTVSIPPFTVGTTNPVVVTATKINQAQGATVELRATDSAGRVVVCDPAMTTVVRDTGKPTSTTVTGIAQDETTITIANGSPGLRRLDISVNGVHFDQKGLSDGQTVTVTIPASVMHSGTNNSVTLSVHGDRPGGSADVVIGN